jgi:hypothetical protein
LLAAEAALGRVCFLFAAALVVLPAVAVVFFVATMYVTSSYLPVQAMDDAVPVLRPGFWRPLKSVRRPTPPHSV